MHMATLLVVVLTSRFGIRSDCDFMKVTMAILYGFAFKITYVILLQNFSLLSDSQVLKKVCAITVICNCRPMWQKKCNNKQQKTTKSLPCRKGYTGISFVVAVMRRVLKRCVPVLCCTVLKQKFRLD